jgi:hypothetical protein
MSLSPSGIGRGALLRGCKMKVNTIKPGFQYKESLEIKIRDWAFQKQKLDDAKSEEMRLRKEICQEIMGEQIGKSNSQYKDLKLKYNTSYKLDESKWIELKENFDDNDLALDCVRYKPSLSKSAMNKLDENHIFWECISESPAAPTIEIKKEEEPLLTFG